MEKQTKFFLYLLVAILLAKAAIVVYIILQAGIGLGPDEAQYWTWSRQLDFGYYSKPPGIAWQIWMGTHLFGNTELGVRFGSIVLATLIPLAVYWLSLECRLKPSTAFWASLAMALCPLGLMSSFLAITDVGMVLFWTLAYCLVAYGLNRNQSLPYYAIGLCVLAGALFKWPMYLFWVCILGLIIWDRKLFSKHLFGGILVSLLGLLPSVIWNAQNDWATFRHVFGTIKAKESIETGTTELLKGNFAEFIGAQALLMSPILFILLLASFWILVRESKKISSGLLFCGWTSLAIFCAYALTAFFKKMQGNWCDFVYPPSIVFMAWFALERKPFDKWLKAGLALSIVLLAFALSIPLIQSQSFLGKHPIPYKFNPFRHNIGWDGLELELKKTGYDPKEHFLFSDKYQTSSILSFYAPGQKRAYFLNLQGIRKNQFSYWPDMAEEQLGKTGYFVLTENSPSLERGMPETAQHYQEYLEEYFDDVRFLGIRPLFYAYGNVVKGAYLFKCIGYNGKSPVEKDRY